MWYFLWKNVNLFPLICWNAMLNALFCLRLYFVAKTLNAKPNSHYFRFIINVKGIAIISLFKYVYVFMF